MFYKLITLIFLFLISSTGFTSFAQDDKSTVKDSATQSTVTKEPIKNVTIPAGTKFSITINSPLASNRNATGSTFSAVLTADFIFNGDTISTKGSQVIGKIVESKTGQGLGDAKLSIQISEITVNKQLTPVVTNPINVKGGRGRKSEAEISAGTIEEVSLKQALIIK